MKERRTKGVVESEAAATYNHNNDSMDYHQYYSTSDLLPCKKHPSSSSVGICAYCLKDRLVKLVCSDCGEQRLSSCSCSEISPNRNSCTLEVGSVGRVSFLIENEKNETLIPNPKPKFQDKSAEEDDEFVILRRSSSNSVEIKRNSNGRFWKIGKLFRKKKEGKTLIGGFDEKSDNWVMGDQAGGGGGGRVSRSRSLCSFRNGGGGGGGGVFGSEDGGDSILSGARSSISAARSSGVNGGLFLESGRRSGFSEAEPRRSGFDGEKRDSFMDVDGGGFNRRVFSLRESDFKGMDESRFIDLKLDFSSSELKPETHNSAKIGDTTMSAFGSIRCGNFMGNDGDLSSGGSCRITVNDRGIKRGRKSMKSWRWIFRQHGKKKDEGDLMFKT